MIHWPSQTVSAHDALAPIPSMSVIEMEYMNFLDIITHLHQTDLNNNEWVLVTCNAAIK